VVGVRRGDRLLEQPDPNVPFDAGDIVYMVGTRDAIRRAVGLFELRENASTETAPDDGAAA
jgi:K+/H+ antiporter YhaU regulatory subunit KhtT